MKKYFLLLLLSLTAVCAAGCSSCGCDGEHTHGFVREIAIEKYLKSPATCVKKAVYYYSCECGERGEETFEYGGFGEHTFLTFTPNADASCTENGTETAKCEFCDETYTREAENSKLAHTFLTYTPNGDATCVKNETETAKCEYCSQTDTREIDNSKLAHTFLTYTPNGDATCIKNETETAKCENCTATDTREIEGTKTEHVFSDYVSDRNATCTKNGTETAKCENCTTIHTREVADSKLPHSFVIYYSNHNATCDKNCTETAKCENCTATDTREIENSKLQHVFENYVSDDNATCDKNCTETAKCEFCTATDTREIEGSKKPHVFGNYISDDNGTCTENGTETAKCENCTATDTREMEDSKIHSFTDGICSKCGARYATQGLEYRLNADKASYNVTGAGRATDTDVYLPSEYKGLPVTGIDGGALSHLSPESVFIPDGVTGISIIAFSRCSLLKSITVSGGNAKYKSVDGVLYSKDGTKLLQYPEAKAGGVFEVPVSVTDVNTFSLQNNRFINEIKIHDGVAELGNKTFTGCSALRAITVSEGNAKYKSVDGVLYSKDGSKLLQYPMRKEGERFEIPSGVTVVGENAFYYCGQLKDIIIPSGVISVGDSAFAYCTSLKTISLPAGVTELGRRAFECCSSLERVDIPEGIKNIGLWMFSDCVKLRQVTIPEGVERIDGYAFRGCVSLESVVIPVSLKRILPAAFLNCAALERVYYSGTAEQWKEIDFGVSNTDFVNSELWFYSENQPSGEGNFWHYAADGSVAIW